jgi:hypothetical protein
MIWSPVSPQRIESTAHRCGTSLPQRS